MIQAFYICILNQNKEGYDDSVKLRTILNDICVYYGITLNDATGYHSVGKISDDVKKAIENSDIVFADANSNNENVWYEIGYADHVNPYKVICLSKKDRKLPFDRAHIRSQIYSNSNTGIKLLKRNLSKMVGHIIINGTIDQMLFEVKQVGIDSISQKLSSHFSNKKIQKFGCERLEQILLDENRDEQERKASLKSLLILYGDRISDSIFIEITRPQVNIAIRSYAYNRLSPFKRKVDQIVWEQGIDSISSSNELVKEYAQAVSVHWLRGHIDDSWFRQNVIRSSDMKLRTNVLDEIKRNTHSEAMSI